MEEGLGRIGTEGFRRNLGRGSSAASACSWSACGSDGASCPFSWQEMAAQEEDHRKELEAQEKHSYFFAQEYTDPRIGLHIYASRNRIKGYYESGDRTRTGALGCLKTWFWAKEYSTNGITTVWAFVNFNILETLLLVMGVIGIIAGGSIVGSDAAPESLFGAVIIILLLLSDIKEEWTIYRILCDAYKNK